MARIPKQPLLRGTIGNLIFYSVGDRQYVRSKPSRVRQPNTPAQLLARDKFRQSSKLAKALSKACPLLGRDESFNKTKSSYHTLLGVLRTSPFRNNSDPVRWVWEKLVIREGEEPTIKLAGKYHSDTEQLELTWEGHRAAEGSILLVAGIHTETLAVTIHRLSIELDRGMVQVSPRTAWYGCVQSPGIKIRVSGSQFLGLIEET